MILKYLQIKEISDRAVKRQTKLRRKMAEVKPIQDLIPRKRNLKYLCRS